MDVEKKKHSSPNPDKITTWFFFKELSKNMMVPAFILAFIFFIPIAISQFGNWQYEGVCEQETESGRVIRLYSVSKRGDASTTVNLETRLSSGQSWDMVRTIYQSTMRIEIDCTYLARSQDVFVFHTLNEIVVFDADGNTAQMQDAGFMTDCQQILDIIAVEATLPVAQVTLNCFGNRLSQVTFEFL